MDETVYDSDYRPLRVSEDIVPLGEFRTHTARVLGRLRQQKRPVVITQNGKPAAVLVTPEDFDRLQEHGRFLAAVSEGLADVEAGRIVADEEAAPVGARRRRRARR